MKSAVLLLIGLSLATAAITSNLYNDKNQQKQADKEFVQRQLNVLTLFFNIQNPTENAEQVAYAKNFNFQQQQQNSTNPSVVRKFQATFEQGDGLLPQQKPFNYFNPNHYDYAIQLFDLFYFAKDFDTFYTAACWARQNVNGFLFVYAYSVAVLNRPETQGIYIPSQSEVFPYLYINSEAIQIAHEMKQRGVTKGYVQSNLTSGYEWNPGQQAQSAEDYPFSGQAQVQVEFENQANQYQGLNQENREGRVAYFTEDIDFNQQFAYEQLKNPAWFNGQKYQSAKKNQNQNNGENFYYYLQQILARYNLERYANDLPAVKPFQFNQNIKYGYNPQLQYYFGQAVPSRPDNFDLDNANSNAVQQFLKIDSRIADAVDSNQAQKDDGSYVQLDEESGVKTLGNLIQNNGNSINGEYYAANQGQYNYLEQCRRVVGSGSYIGSQYQNAPSAVENDNTALRDSGFYQCVSRLVNYVQLFKNKQKPYSKQQLNYPGVKVQNVKVDKLVTYWVNKEIEIFNAIGFQKNEDPWTVPYLAGQQQLSYKPFNYQIQVDSAQDGEAVVRIFIGQKYDGKLFRRISLEQARQTFVEVDRFTYKLKSGQNTIQRSSEQSTRFQQSAPQFKEIYNAATAATQGSQPFVYDPNLNERQAVFPQNLLLPKGLQAVGADFVLAVVVNQFQGSREKGEQPQDGRPQGFPFDRVVREDTFRQAQNINFRTVKVFNTYPKDAQQSY